MDKPRTDFEDGQDIGVKWAAARLQARSAVLHFTSKAAADLLWREAAELIAANPAKANTTGDK